jgi:hypothetical protein
LPRLCSRNCNLAGRIWDPFRSAKDARCVLSGKRRLSTMPARSGRDPISSEPRRHRSVRDVHRDSGPLGRPLLLVARTFAPPHDLRRRPSPSAASSPRRPLTGRPCPAVRGSICRRSSRPWSPASPRLWEPSGWPSWEPPSSRDDGSRGQRSSHARGAGLRDPAPRIYRLCSISGALRTLAGKHSHAAFRPRHRRCKVPRRPRTARLLRGG